MPFEQTITIINNSGKIISTGRQLVGIFKEARSAYREKKEALRSERAAHVRRAHTFSGPIVEEFDDGRSYGDLDDGCRHHRGLGYRPAPLFLEGAERRRRQSLDDGDRRSRAPEHSSAGRRRHHPPSRSSSRPPLTASNLRTFSEASTTPPSAAPPRGNRTLSGPSPLPAPPRPPPPPTASTTTAAASPRASMRVHRPRSDPALGRHATDSPAGPLPPPPPSSSSSSKPLDMHLAYGSIPPDLASRTDLDPFLASSDGLADAADPDDEPEDHKAARAKTLVDRIEALLNEAQCIHHTAASIICHLQDNPEAAAAVALTLAELSAVLTKLSPAFLGVVKGGSPAVFALLASPQFLIGTGIAVGVTVVVFGGWKIVKRISEVRAARDDDKQAFAAATAAAASQPPIPLPHLRGGPGAPAAQPNPALLAGSQAGTQASAGFDEALVLEEELSTIETWRRGIVTPLDGDDGDGSLGPWEGTEADVELISPEAMRSRIGDDDERTLRSVRSRHTTRSHGTHHGRSHHQHDHRHHHARSHRDSSGRGKKPKDGQGPLAVPDRTSSKDFRGGGGGSSGEAMQDDTPDDRHRRHRRERPADGTASGAGSSVSSTGSVRSARSAGSAARNSDRGSRAPPSDAGSASGKEKKGSSGGSMLKQLFKRKEKAAGDKGRDGAVASSVMA